MRVAVWVIDKCVFVPMRGLDRLKPVIKLLRISNCCGKATGQVKTVSSELPV